MSRRDQSSPSGGSAAILGFLYQLLSTGARLIDASASIGTNSQDLAGITAILEPMAGGDAVITTPERHCVQFKYRSRPIDAGVLSDTILPDLFGMHCTEPCASYELRSNQPLTGPAQTLLDSLWSHEATASMSTYLEKAREACRAKMQRVRGNDARFDETFSEFLVLFRIGDKLELNDARDKLEVHFRALLPYRDQLEAKINQLTGELLNRASRNGGVISGAQLHEILGAAIGTEPLSSLKVSLSAAIQARGYSPMLDVRTPLLLASVAPVEFVSGPSGNGKSWSLYRLAQDAIDHEIPAVLINAANRSELEREMQRIIAIEALGHDSPITPAGLGHSWRRRLDAPNATILVLWEGCRDVEELKKLFYQNGLGEGLKLVAELPPETELAPFEAMAVAVHKIEEFSESEFFRALEVRGVNAGDVPAMIRRSFRRPVLCGIYGQLASEAGRWDPENEYRVLKRFWDRASERAGNLSRARLKLLAKRIVESGSKELTDTQMLELGFEDHQLAALSASGWLHQLSGKWRFAHDRLLTWAIAEWLAEEFSKPTTAAVEIADHINRLQTDNPGDPAILHGLGFLMMDVIWLAVTQEIAPTRLAELIQQLENDWQNRPTDGLYQELLPTVGSAIVDTLFARVAMERGDPAHPDVVHYVAKAILALELPSEAIAGTVRRLSEAGASEWRLLLLLGAHWPLPAHREKIWDDMIDAHRKLDAEKGHFADFDLHYQAVSMQCRADARWLEAKLLSTTNPKALSVATGLLRQMDSLPDEKMWRRLAPHLTAHMAADDRERLVTFIRCSNDRTRIPFLLGEIERNSYSAAAALEALIVLDPAKGLECIKAQPLMESQPRWRSGLHQLLEHAPADAEIAIAHWLMAIDPTGCKLALVWRGEEPFVGVPTISILLNRLDQELATEDGGDSRTLRLLFELLGSAILHPRVNNCFCDVRGKRLANNLRMRSEAIARGAHAENAEEIWRILCRIGGPDLEACIIALLDGPLEHRAAGVHWSVRAPTTDIIERLERMACDWDTPYEQGCRYSIWRLLISIRPESWYPQMCELIRSPDSLRRAMGLDLFEHYGFFDDAEKLLESVRVSEPGSDLEARAINLAIYMGARNPLLLERAFPRFNKEGDSNGHLAACNVLLQERESDARTMLDNHLIGFSGQTSWNSTDMEVLAIRLGQDDVTQELLTAAEPFMRRPAFFGERIIDPFVKHGHQGVRDIVLERAFGPPSIDTSDQPNIIEALAGIEIARAEQAFKAAWIDAPGRRQYLVRSSRKLGVAALEVMLDHLPIRGSGSDYELAFRAMCIELRRRTSEALPMILARIVTAAKEERHLLVKSLAWLPDGEEELLALANCHSDFDTRELAADLARIWKVELEAVEAYRSEPESLEKLEYVLELVDPEILFRQSDLWEITSKIQPSLWLCAIAEEIFVRRFNKEGKSRLRRTGVRRRTKESFAADAPDRNKT